MGETRPVTYAEETETAFGRIISRAVAKIHLPDMDLHRPYYVRVNNTEIRVEKTGPESIRVWAEVVIHE